MKRIIAALLAISMALSLVVTLASCGDGMNLGSDTESETKEVMVTIELKLAGGELSDDDDDEWEVRKGEKLRALPTPTKEGYNFVGWFNVDTDEPFAPAKINEDTVFYAKWEEIKSTDSDTSTNVETNTETEISTETETETETEISTETETETDTETETIVKLEEKYAYFDLLANYIKLPDYESYEVNLELDNIQAAIDNYLMYDVSEYVVTRGDDIYIDINVYEENILTADNGEEIGKKGKKIDALSKKNFFVENIGSSSLPDKIETDIINAELNIYDFITRKYSYDDLADYCPEEYEGKSFYFDIKIANKVTKEGDVLEISYKGYKNGKLEEPFDQSYNAKFFLGAHLAIDDFESNLVGKTIGEEFSFYATFPEDYSSEELRGETVIFYVTIKRVYTAPIYNDDFVKRYLPEYDTTREFEEALKREYKFNLIWDFLLEETEILEYPQAEYNEHKNSIETSEASFKEYYGYTFDQYIKNAYNMTRDEYIKSQMKTEMIYYAIAKKEYIEPTHEMLVNERAELIAYYKELYMAQEDLNEDEALEKAEEFVENLEKTYIYENVLYDLVEDFMSENAKVNITEKTYVSISEKLANNE